MTIHEATWQGHRALSKPMWNPASIADMMSDDLDVTEAVVLATSQPTYMWVDNQPVKV